MLVPATLAASTSPAKKPLLIDTVADLRVWLSTSLTVAADDSVTGVFRAGSGSATKDAAGATLLSTGAASCAAMVSVVGAVALLSVPSLTTPEIIRVGSVPKLAGLGLCELWARL